MNNLEDLTLEELNRLKLRKESSARIWKGCNDGSYEMALGTSGYYEVLDEIKKREDNQ